MLSVLAQRQNKTKKKELRDTLGGVAYLLPSWCIASVPVCLNASHRIH